MLVSQLVVILIWRVFWLKYPIGSAGAEWIVEPHNLTEALKTITKSERLETSYSTYKYSRAANKANERNSQLTNDDGDDDDCNSNNTSWRKPKAVKQIMPRKSAKEKNLHEPAAVDSLRKFSRHRLEGIEGSREWVRFVDRRATLPFAQDKFNERTPATDPPRTTAGHSSHSDCSNTTVRPKFCQLLSQVSNRVAVVASHVCALSHSIFITLNTFDVYELGYSVFT